MWIPSELWFTFLARRATEISEAQRRLSLLAQRPSNYGLITSILSYMLQHVGITPILTDQSVARALQDLYFNGVSERFGCFFLHNFDPDTGHLPGIDEEDSLNLLWSLQGNKEPEEETRTKDTTVPSGLAITWKKLCNSLNESRGSQATIEPFVWDPSWLRFSEAEELFCKFTWQFWRVMKTYAFEPLERPPITLKEAMEVWTLESVKRRIKHDVGFKLLPSGDELRGAVPLKFQRQRFETIRRQFFPEPGTEVNKASCWEPLFRRGYVRHFHQVLKRSKRVGEALKAALDGIMLNLQILPYNPGDPKQRTPLWRCMDSVVMLLVNSSYIEVLDRTIKAPEREGRKPMHRKMNSKRELEKALRTNRIGIEAMKKSRAHRKGKPKNWRQPPDRWHKRNEGGRENCEEEGGKAGGGTDGNNREEEEKTSSEEEEEEKTSSEEEEEEKTSSEEEEDEE